jgi:hypothetical protein
MSAHPESRGDPEQPRGAALLPASGKAFAYRSPRTVISGERQAAAAADGKVTGAGEGIRTLDPNLGKVVLYP